MGKLSIDVLESLLYDWLPCEFVDLSDYIEIDMKSVKFIADGFFDYESLEESDGVYHFDLSGIKKISNAEALVLSSTKHFLDLSGLVELNDCDGHAALIRKLLHQESPDYDNPEWFNASNLRMVPPRIAEILASGEKNLALGVAEISVETASCLSRTKRKLVFENLENISAEAARALASSRGDLVFEAITILDDSVAGEFANASGILSIPNLSELRDYPGHLDLARALARGNGGEVVLPGLKSLTDRVALVLAGNEGLLDLSGLEVMSPSVARALSRHAGCDLKLRGLKELSGLVAAEFLNFPLGDSFLLEFGCIDRFEFCESVFKLARIHNINLGGFWVGEVPSASILGEPGETFFGELREIDADTAAVLALSIEKMTDSVGGWFSSLEVQLEFPNLLYFPNSVGGLQLAKKLALQEGGVVLDSLVELDPCVAEVLSRYEGVLSFGRMSGISTETATAFAGHTGVMVLGGISSLFPEVATRLAGHRGCLRFPGLESLTGEAINADLTGHTGELDLSHVLEVSNGWWMALLKKKGILDLSGLTGLSVLRAASVFSVARRCELLLGVFASRLVDEVRSIHLVGLSCLTESEWEALLLGVGDLHLPWLTEISETGAFELAQHAGELQLPALRSVSDSPGHLALMRKLARQGSGAILLGGLRNISTGAAQALAVYRGTLCLSGMRFLTDSAAAALANHDGFLDLSGLVELTDSPGHLDLCRRLALQKERRGVIDLSNIQAMGELAAHALSEYTGIVVLSSLCDASVEVEKALFGNPENRVVGGLLGAKSSLDPQSSPRRFGVCKLTS